MLQMNSLSTIKFNIADYIRRKYIWNELGDYKEYIKREKEALEKATSESSKKMVIINLSAVYYEIADYSKAIEYIKLLDNYELNDKMTFVYYVNLLLYYICNNQEAEADYIYKKSKDIVKKFSNKYVDTVDIHNIRYLNFKGRYHESIKILKLNRIKNTDSDYMNLILADIAFNTDQYHDGNYIMRKMCKEYNQKSPCIKKQIDILINIYMKKALYKKNDTPKPVTSDKELWNKVKEQPSKTILFFMYLGLKKICKTKLVKYAVLPILSTKFLCTIFFPLIYGKVYSEVFTSIISFLFLVYFVGGIGHVSIKYFNNTKKRLLSLIFIVAMTVNILGGFFILDFKGNILDLRYTIFKSPKTYSGLIEKFNQDDQIKGNNIELQIEDKIFIIHDYDYLYNYINNNFETGQKVNVEYLPHTNKIVNIENISQKP